MNERHTIAAYIRVKDCPALLDECLKHLLWVDEIMISDASDNNAVRDLLKQKYPKAKHFFDKTEDHKRRHQNTVPFIESDFILGLDTDEFFTPELAAEILEAVKKPCEFDGFEIPSISYCYGECLGKGATHLRLYRKDKFYTSTIKSVHEMTKVKGPVKVLKEPYHHHNNPILGITAVKSFLYGAVDASYLTDKELENVVLDNLTPFNFYLKVLINFARLNWRFIKVFWSYRKFGFAGLCMAYAIMINTMASNICPTEELRMRKGKISRDRRGYY
jgi:hypothetical protein